METFGYKLKSVREEEGVTLEDAASISGIRLQHLQALENDDFDSLPDEDAVKGILRAYAGLLRVDAEMMIEDYLHERASRRPAPVAVEPTPSKDAGDKSRSRIPILVIAGGFLLTLAIVGSLRSRSGNTTELPAPRSEPSTAASPVKASARPATQAVAEKPNAVAPVQPKRPAAIPVNLVHETVGLNIPDHGVGSAVENRQLVGENDRFAEGTTVWFWTRVEEGASGDRIHHVWLHEGVEASSISLKLGGSPWRTYSNKMLRADSAGSWAVEARDEDGRVLARRDFRCVP
jgi:cytoskeletal protein RodZ